MSDRKPAPETRIPAGFYQTKMRGLLEKALADKLLAYSIIGQSISDEATIGTDTVKICLVSKEEAKFLWDIGNAWGLVNNFRKFNGPGGKYREWGFTIRAEKRRELYEEIRPMPNPDKDRAFRHLASRNVAGGNKKAHGRTKSEIVETLRRRGPLTAREIMYELDLGYGALKTHLRDLRVRKVVTIVGKNTMDIRHSHRRQANLWGINNNEIQV